MNLLDREFKYEKKKQLGRREGGWRGWVGVCVCVCVVGGWGV